MLLCITLLMFLNGSACSLIIHSDREEIEGLPGAVRISEGSSSVVMLYEEAAEHLSNHEFKEAEEVYRKILEIEPDKANGYIGLGSSLIYQDRIDEAYGAYSEALRLSPESVSVQIGLGSISYLYGDYQISESYYARALELDPDQPDAHWGRALALEMLGRDTEAIHHLEEFIRLAPDSQQIEEAQRMLDEIRAH
jgi:tetratricopeptide (TPR) repeat protein